MGVRRMEHVQADDIWAEVTNLQYFMVAEEGWNKAYVVDTKLDITVAGPFRYAEEAVYEARMMERDAEEEDDEQD